MTRALLAGVLAVVVTAGCATRGSVRHLQSDIAAARSELADLRATQEGLSRDIGRALDEIKSLDARGIELQASLRETASGLSRLVVRVDDTDRALRERRALVAPPPPAAEPKAPPPPAERPQGETPPRSGGAEQAYAAALATLQAREHGQAVLDFLDFIAKFPKHPLAGNAQYWIGEAYYAQRDYRQALVEFEKVLERGPTAQKAPDALLKIGLCYTNLRESSRARKTWQRLVREYPDSTAARRARSLLAARGPARR